ncbi:MAG: PAS domain S-box protein [Syntrophobacter sp.]
MKGIRITPGYSAHKCALRIALFYAVLGALWIMLSDWVVNLLFGTTPLALLLQTVKGWLFVAITALMLYLLTGSTIRTSRKSEEILRENQRVLSTLFGNLPGMAYRCKANVECTIEFVSAGARELTGYPPADLADKAKISDLVLPEDREMVRAGIKVALAEKEPFRLVYRIRKADGVINWVWEQGRGIYSSKGELVAVEGFITDITERKNAEEALTRSEEIYRALVEGTSDAILMVDRNRNFVSVNRAFIDLFGYSREELEGQTIRLVHPSEESFDGFTSMTYPAVDTAPVRFEWELMRKDGGVFPVEGTYSTILGPDGTVAGHVGIIRDITERRKVEEELALYREHLEEMVRERTRELEEAQKALVQEEKLKTLGAMSAEVAHEIRNPLVSIGGFARRLHKKYPDSLEAEIILSESRRLETILSRITHYLRPIEMRSRECYVNSILAESLDLLAPELENEHVDVQLDLDPGLSRTHVDPDILTQVFVSIIRNAVKMLDSKREITIRTYDGEQVVYVDFRNDIAKKPKDPELMLLPFDPDEQVMGMSSSFKLLKGMGGTLSFSEADHQAVFKVSLRKCRSDLHAPVPGTQGKIEGKRSSRLPPA